ncbi:hypothetical protein FACS1894169_16250 [Bacteroidia bacterium]|nr:hypothetical protein FACS1894169_16250 [Bacteroidia bacterium]
MAFLKGQNTCAIKLSYALNESGYIIPKKLATQKRDTQAGSKDRNGTSYNYILGSEEMGDYLKAKLGTADYKLIGVTQDNYKEFVKKIEAIEDFKGFIYMKANDSKTFEAMGHVDLIFNKNKFFGGQEARVYGSGESLSTYLNWNSDPGIFWNTNAKLDVYIWQIKDKKAKK